MDVEDNSGTVVSFPFEQHEVDALFYHLDTHREHFEEKPVILRLHGILGNLLDETEHFLPGVLASAGYSSLTMNTLLANLGLFFGFGIFDDAVKQIDAGCQFLRQVGFKKIVVAGHGLGGCMAIRYGALANDPAKHSDIRGIIAVATPYSMPDTIRRRWERFGSEPSYDEVCRKAQRLFNPPPEDRSTEDEIVVVKRAHGYTARPEHTDIYTLKTWWALGGPEAQGAEIYRYIGQIRRPLLLVHGTRDDLIQRSEFENLCRIASKSGNREVTAIQLDTNHTFDGKHEEMGQLMIKWLTDICE
ncbi:MAG: alpha/beta hydrolase [Candidatus Binatia bacterium]